MLFVILGASTLTSLSHLYFYLPEVHVASRNVTSHFGSNPSFCKGKVSYTCLHHHAVHTHIKPKSQMLFSTVLELIEMKHWALRVTTWA